MFENYFSIVYIVQGNRIHIFDGKEAVRLAEGRYILSKAEIVTYESEMDTICFIVK